MPSTSVEVQTVAGPCHTQIFTPEGSGPWPAVILFFDAGGQRSSMTAIAERISKDGFLVAIPDLFHRSGSIYSLLAPGIPHEEKNIMSFFADPEARKGFFEKFYAPALDEANLKETVGAVLDHLEQRSDVAGKIGTTGYCMGGNASVRVGYLFADRVAATAAFHAGGLVTDQPNSPHLGVAKIKSRVYVAGASHDDSFNDAAKATLEAALTTAGIDHTVETYPGGHGFAVTDTGAFDQESSDRHYAAMSSLFGATLRA